jgi:hypothetical protein
VKAFMPPTLNDIRRSPAGLPRRRCRLPRGLAQALSDG